jgi:hypothetical protein
VAALTGCPPGPPGSSQDTRKKLTGVCVTKNAVPASIDTEPIAGREAAAAKICDDIRIPDLSQLPPELAGAGCTTLGSYQLGYGHKSARYAICPAVSDLACDCPNAKVPPLHRCTTPLARFVACFKAPDLLDGQPTGRRYGWAHVATSVCDACLGSSLPSGMVLVAWHDVEHCFKEDSSAHDAAIARKAGLSPPPPPPPPGPDSGPCSTCPGGCMAPGAPRGL